LNPAIAPAVDRIRFGGIATGVSAGLHLLQHSQKKRFRDMLVNIENFCSNDFLWIVQ